MSVPRRCQCSGTCAQVAASCDSENQLFTRTAECAEEEAAMELHSTQNSDQLSQMCVQWSCAIAARCYRMPDLHFLQSDTASYTCHLHFFQSFLLLQQLSPVYVTCSDAHIRSNSGIVDGRRWGRGQHWTGGGRGAERNSLKSNGRFAFLPFAAVAQHCMEPHSLNRFILM
jgi:hypothetical protein